MITLKQWFSLNSPPDFRSTSPINLSPENLLFINRFFSVMTQETRARGIVIKPNPSPSFKRQRRDVHRHLGHTEESVLNKLNKATGQKGIDGETGLSSTTAALEKTEKNCIIRLNQRLSARALETLQHNPEMSQTELSSKLFPSPNSAAHNFLMQILISSQKRE